MLELIKDFTQSHLGTSVDWRLAAAGGVVAAFLAASLLQKALTPKKKLAGSVVVVTGASSGIGRAAAKHLAEFEGATVMALARTSDKLQTLADEVAKSSRSSTKGGSIIPVTCDCSDENEVRRAVSKARSEQANGKSVTALINNAGTGLWKFLHELEDSSEVYSAMKVPVCASLVTTKGFLPLLAETARTRKESMKGWGLLSFLPFAPGSSEVLPAPRILTVTSPASVLAFPGATCYSIARRAMRGFTDGMRVDLRGTGIEAQEVLLGEVSSSYWENNPDSRQNIPGISAILPCMTEEQAGAAVAVALTTLSPAN